MWDHRARIENVHDGDTVTVYQDDGRDEYARLKIRLFGTFAPELKQTGGTDTQQFAQQWVTQRAGTDPNAWPFIVTMHRNKSNTDEDTTLGRYVAMIYTADMTECLNIDVSAYVRTHGYPGGDGAPTPHVDLGPT